MRNTAAVKRIGEGRRRAPGDVVAGWHPALRFDRQCHEGHDVIGRIVFASDTGSVLVESDDGRKHAFTASEAAKHLRTLQECDAPAHRNSDGWHLIREAA